MKHEGSWRQSLPSDAPEREFLLAAEGDRPPAAAVDRGWTALCAAAGIASVTTVAAPGFAASAAPTASAAAAKTAATATAATVGKAALGVVGTSVAAKAVVVGFVVGMGALSMSYAVRQVRTSSLAPSAAMPAASTQRAARTGVALQPGQVASPTAVSPAAASSTTLLPDALSSLPNHQVAAEITPQSGPKRALESSSASGGASRRDARGLDSTVAQSPGNDVRDHNDSLAVQAEQLAQLKRLLDSGSTHEAAAQLQTLAARGELSALAEDRDALLIQALVKTGRSAEATGLAERFFKRYPTSPHRQGLRKLLGFE